MQHLFEQLLGRGWTTAGGDDLDRVAHQALAIVVAQARGHTLNGDGAFTEDREHDADAGQGFQVLLDQLHAVAGPAR